MEKKEEKNRLGQGILEYALILGVVIAALVAMQFYIKRGIQAATKVVADQLGDQSTPEILTYDKGGYLMGSAASRQSRGYRHSTTDVIMTPRMDRKTSYNEITITTGTAAYNAGDYGQ